MVQFLQDTDNLENYEIIDQLSVNDEQTVSFYVVKCKRRRLGARKIILKKTAPLTTTTQFLQAASIHRSLYHPNIVSLISAFTSHDHHYQILELCSGGSLSSCLETRSSPAMNVEEARDIARGMTDALSYLAKELVVHRNIIPSNILLTTEGRVKLSGFEFASYIPCQKLDAKILGSCPYIAPEILAGSEDGSSSDLWSLGCVMITCLAVKGLPSTPFSTENALRMTLFTTLKDLPSEAKDLITSLMKLDPHDRIPLSRILFHQFFCSSSPAIPSRPLQYPEYDYTPKVDLRETARRKENPPVPQRYGKLGVCASDPARSVLRNKVINVELRKLLSDEISASSNSKNHEQRRVVSDPLPNNKLPFATNTLASELASLTSSPHPIPPRQTNSLSSAIQLRKRSRIVSYGSSADANTATKVHSPAPFYEPVEEPTIPVGTSRPYPFTTDLLSPRTHKTAHGQITILPSRSLLLDFRVAQRRSSEKGDKVLVIDPDGQNIKVHSAPHLSTPCCLVEPIEEYHIANLPAAYWKQYNDAGRLIDRIRQRTPKLILYESGLKCTLMANGPMGDIELLFLSASNNKHIAADQKSADNARMRIRFSRQSQSIEIARCISGVQGKEWINRVFRASGDTEHSISFGDWETLEDEERRAMEETHQFVQLCEAHESARQSQDNAAFESILKPPTGKVPNSPARKPPPLFSSASIIHHRATDSSSFRSDWAVGNTLTPELRDTFTSTSQRVETRYIASLGWCMRHSSRVSQGGRYKIMFVDGSCLDVDVDEEWTEFTRLSGKVSRKSIRDAYTDGELVDRMKSFSQFIALFEHEGDEE
ncbi:kinase-like domain-containing protein [Mycena floridula]|nr:kinase-like domain-containing protein [Mycena floridula]